MIWLLAHRRMSTKLMDSPFTESAVEGAHSLVYQPGVQPVANTGQEGSEGLEGTFSRGLHRISGVVFTYNGNAAEVLLGVAVPINLIVYYTSAKNVHRKRTLLDVVFIGDATVRIPPLNTGLGDLIGVPFRVNVPAGDTLADHVVDELD